jgi:hypothetical protein
MDSGSSAALPEFDFPPQPDAERHKPGIRRRIGKMAGLPSITISAGGGFGRRGAPGIISSSFRPLVIIAAVLRILSRSLVGGAG